MGGESAVLVTFADDSLPTKLYIGQGHVSLRVEPFTEAVKQCFRRLKFGHLQAVCKAKNKKCIICSDEYHGDCNEKPRCTNCGGGHRSNARECPAFQRENEIKKTMAYRNVSYAQAKDLLRDRYAGRRFVADLDDEYQFPSLKKPKTIEMNVGRTVMSPCTEKKETIGRRLVTVESKRKYEMMTRKILKDLKLPISGIRRSALETDLMPEIIER